MLSAGQQQLLEVLRTEFTAESVAALRESVRRGELPEDFVNRIVEAFLRDPNIVILTENEIIAVAHEVSIDAASILSTTSGRFWLRRLIARIASRTAGRTLSKLFFGG